MCVRERTYVCCIVHRKHRTYPCRSTTCFGCRAAVPTQAHIAAEEIALATCTWEFQDGCRSGFLDNVDTGNHDGCQRVLKLDGVLCRTIR